MFSTLFKVIPLEHPINLTWDERSYSMPCLWIMHHNAPNFWKETSFFFKILIIFEDMKRNIMTQLIFPFQYYCCICLLHEAPLSASSCTSNFLVVVSPYQNSISSLKKDKLSVLTPFVAGSKKEKTPFVAVCIKLILIWIYCWCLVDKVILDQFWLASIILSLYL